MSDEHEHRFSTIGPYNLTATLSNLSLGSGDPCLRVDGEQVRLAFSTDRGAVVAECRAGDDEVAVRLRGPDAERFVPHLPTMLGLDYRPPEFDGPRRLRVLAHKFAGLRLPRAPLLFPRVVQIVLQQLISYHDACAGWRDLVRRYGQEVEGDDDLIAPPRPEVLARMATYQFVECGILPQHGRRISGLARIASGIERAWGGGVSGDSLETTSDLLLKQPGVGPWTVGYLRGSSMGDSDALVLGDYGFPKHVVYFFTGEERDDATDEDMLRYFEPYRPHRFLVRTLIVKGAPRPPRRGPRGRRLRERMLGDRAKSDRRKQR